MLTCLVDGDILRYEVGFGAETGWRAVTNDPDAIPPFQFVERMLLERIENIKATVGTTTEPRIFLTEGKTFRDELAITKPYKGTRKSNKPWHFRNLTAYLSGVLGAVIATGIEADDLMAIEHTASNGETIICSRDKDLKQIPGYLYSWELGKQASWGPEPILPEGSLIYDAEANKLKGTGYLWFLAQVLTGDVTDNIPGLPGCGPKRAFDILAGPETEQVAPYERVRKAYEEKYGKEEYEARLLEQGQLCWIVRRFNADGSPELWTPGLEC